MLPSNVSFPPPPPSMTKSAPVESMDSAPSDPSAASKPVPARSTVRPSVPSSTSTSKPSPPRIWARLSLASAITTSSPLPAKMESTPPSPEITSPPSVPTKVSLPMPPPRRTPAVGLFWSGKLGERESLPSPPMRVRRLVMEPGEVRSAEAPIAVRVPPSCSSSTQSGALRSMVVFTPNWP